MNKKKTKKIKKIYVEIVRTCCDILFYINLSIFIFFFKIIMNEKKKIVIFV